MKLLLITLLTCATAFSFTSCTNTQAGRGYRAYGVNSIATMSSAPGGWSVERSRGGQTNLSYTNPVGYAPQ